MDGEESLSKWYEENIQTNLEDSIRPELERIKRIFQDVNGEILPVNTEQSVAKQCCSITLGKAVASLADKRETHEVKLEKFYSVIDGEKENIRANLSNMKKKGFLKKVDQGTYKINPSSVSEMLDYILGGENE